MWCVLHATDHSQRSHTPSPHTLRREVQSYVSNRGVRQDICETKQSQRMRFPIPINLHKSPTSHWPPRLYSRHTLDLPTRIFIFLVMWLGVGNLSNTNVLWIGKSQFLCYYSENVTIISDTNSAIIMGTLQKNGQPNEGNEMVIFHCQYLKGIFAKASSFDHRWRSYWVSRQWRVRWRNVTHASDGFSSLRKKWLQEEIAWIATSYLRNCFPTVCWKEMKVR